MLTGGNGGSEELGQLRISATNGGGPEVFLKVVPYLLYGVEMGDGASNRRS